MSAKADIKARRKRAKLESKRNKMEKVIYTNLLKDDIRQLVATSREFDFAGWHEVVITEHGLHEGFDTVTIEDVSIEDKKPKNSTLILKLSSYSCSEGRSTVTSSVFVSLSGDIYYHSSAVADDGREESFTFWLNLDNEPWTITEQIALNIREATKKLYLN